MPPPSINEEPDWSLPRDPQQRLKVPGEWLAWRLAGRWLLRKRPLSSQP